MEMKKLAAGDFAGKLIRILGLKRKKMG